MRLGVLNETQGAEDDDHFLSLYEEQKKIKSRSNKRRVQNSELIESQLKPIEEEADNGDHEQIVVAKKKHVRVVKF